MVAGALVPLDDAAAAARKAAAKRAAVKLPECPTIGSRSVVFAKATSGSSFVTEDKQEVRLAGVMAPGEGGETAARSAADAAREALERALRAGAITLAPAEVPDRYGRIVAQVFAGGAWVQGALLNSGAMRVSPDRASLSCIGQLLTAEDQARTARLGHWRDGSFALRTPEQLKAHVGTFQTVEGEVTTASTNKGRAYINFGADYKTDFTVVVAPDDLKLFRQARFDVKKLAGKHVRVRGWVESYNGPEMEVSMPGAIQLVDQAPSKDMAKTADVTKASDVAKTADAEKSSKQQATPAKKKRTRKKKTT